WHSFGFMFKLLHFCTFSHKKAKKKLLFSISKDSSFITNSDQLSRKLINQAPLLNFLIYNLKLAYIGFILKQQKLLLAILSDAVTKPIQLRSENKLPLLLIMLLPFTLNLAHPLL